MSRAGRGWPWALLLSCAAACASSERTTGTQRSAIVDGAVDTADDAVGFVTLRRTRCSSPAVVAKCTAVLVSDRVAVTAAHCVEPAESGFRYEVGFGPDAASAKDVTYDVVLEVQRHPKYDPATHAFDVAVLRLATPMKTPALGLATMPPSVGDAVRAVGFGIESISGSPGTKRTGTMKVSKVTDDGFESTPDPSMTCSADSGGPVFAGDQLVGFTASGDAGCRDYAFNVRADVVRDFVQTFVDASAGEPSGPPPGKVSPEGLCSFSCASDDDCPAGLACIASGMDRRCVLPGQPPGNFSQSCTDTCAGGATCDRLWPDGDFACLCFSPCEGGPTPPPDADVPVDGGTSAPPEESGCHCSFARTQTSWGALLALLVLFRARRR